MSREKTLYHRVYQQILHDARDGTLPRGTAIPTVKQLMSRYHVKQSTLCRTLAELKQDQYITARQGGGIYLSEKAWADAGVDQDAGSQAQGLFSSNFAPVKLRVSFFDDSPNHQAMWRKILARFQIRYPYVEVEPVFGARPDDRGRLDDDLLQLQPPQSLDRSWQEQLYPAPRSCVKPEDYPAHSFDHLLNADNRVYGVPVFMALPVLLVNLDLLRRAGVVLEETALDWERYKGVALALGMAHGAGRMPPDSHVAAYIHSSFLYLCASGQDPRQLVAADGFDWGRPGIGEFIVELAELGVRNQVVMPNQVHFNRGGALGLFAAGKLALLGALSRNVNDLYPAGLPKSVKVLPFPLAPSGMTFGQSSHLCVSRKSPRPGECLALLQFLGSRETMEIVAKHNEMPARPEGVANINPLYAGLFARAVPTNFLANHQMEFILGCFNPVVDCARDGVMAPAAALELLREKYQDFVARLKDNPPEQVLR